MSRHTSFQMPDRRSFRPRVDSLEDRKLLAAGALDPTFGGTGVVTRDLGSTGDKAQAIAVQPWDNKVVVACWYRSSGGGNDFALARFNPDGSLDDGSASDTTPGDKFGANGLVFTDFNGGQDIISQILLTSDHKVLAVGSASANSGQGVALARYNTNGTLDTAFGSGGKVITQLSAKTTDGGGAVILDPSGRIIVGGHSYQTSSQRGYSSYTYANVLMRYNANGSLDTTFGNKGKVVGTYSGPGTYDFWGTLRLQPTGSSYKIVAEGSDQGSHALAKFNDNGSRDTTFGNNGEVLLGLLPGGGSVVPVAFQADGKIVGAYADGTTDHEAIVVIRYNPDGSLDGGFGTGGKVITTANSLFGGSPAGTRVRAVAIDSAGRIDVAGGAGLYGGNGLDSLLLRYDASGALDTSFGSNGAVITNNSLVYSNEEYTSLVLQSDGKIVAAGYVPSSFDPNSGNATLDLSVARYLGDTPPPAPLAATRPTTTPTATDPTLVPLVLGEPSFLESLASGKRRRAF